MHILGTAIALFMLVLLTITGDLWYLLAALAVGYGFAWFSHLTIEHNRPATFSYAWWSLLADFRMFSLACTGRLNAELERHQIRAR